MISLQLARKSPQRLDRNVTFLPKLAFQWSDGNMILTDGNYFATYDAYWNVATFSGLTRDYFPGIPSEAVGIAHQGDDTYLWLSERANVIVSFGFKKILLKKLLGLQHEKVQNRSRISGQDKRLCGLSG